MRPNRLVIDHVSNDFKAALLHCDALENVSMKSIYPRVNTTYPYELDPNLPLVASFYNRFIVVRFVLEKVRLGLSP